MNEEPHDFSALQALFLAEQAMRSGDRSQARCLSALAARLDPANERPWLILAALAAPQAE
jgi:hypothetical protein